MKRKVKKKKDTYAKIVNAVKGEIRRQFSRSNMYKEVFDRNRVEKPRVTSTGKVHKTPLVFYRCESCKALKPKSEGKVTNFQVDHIEAIGKGYYSLNDMEEFYKKVFEKGNLQLLCRDCHVEKTKVDLILMDLDLDF